MVIFVEDQARSTSCERAARTDTESASATEASARPRGSAPTTRVVSTLIITKEEEVQPLDVRVAKDLVTKFVPRVCEDASR